MNRRSIVVANGLQQGTVIELGVTGIVAGPQEFRGETSGRVPDRALRG